MSSSKMGMKLIKNNVFFLPPPSGQTTISMSTSSAKLGNTGGYTMLNKGNRNCSAMLFSSTKGCASCSGTK